jgi:hypothetical protein
VGQCPADCRGAKKLMKLTNSWTNPAGIRGDTSPLGGFSTVYPFNNQ